MSIKYGVYDKRVLQDRDGVPLVFPKFFYKVEKGYGFAASHRFESVTSGDYRDLLFENPSGSGVKAVIAEIEIVGLAQLYVDIYVNNTVTSHGTAIQPFNLNTGSPIASKMVIEYGGSYTLGDLIYNMVVPGGNRGRAIGGSVAIGETVILVPGKNFVMRVTNSSAATTDFSVRALWWEE